MESRTTPGGIANLPTKKASLHRPLRTEYFDDTQAARASVRQPRVLVADPDKESMDGISQLLVAEGFKLEYAVDGEQTINAFKTFQPDIVLLELRLPKLPGLDVLREIRRSSDVPAIILTDRADETDRIVGLELGADDVLVKPFGPRELLARINAVLRRSRCECGNIRSQQTTRDYKDTITIDRSRQQAKRGNEVLQLTATEFRILDALTSHSEQTLTRAQLLELVAHDSSIFDRTLDKHIANLRKKIEANPSHPRHLITIFGVGYQFRF